MRFCQIFNVCLTRIIPRITDKEQIKNVDITYKKALIYSPSRTKSISSKDSALRVLSPPQKPTIKKDLYAEQLSFLETKYVKAAVAIRQPKKFATIVQAGKYDTFGKINGSKYLASAPSLPPKKTKIPFMFLIPFPYNYNTVNLKNFNRILI